MAPTGKKGAGTRHLTAAAWAAAAITGCSHKAGEERVPPPPVVGVVEARQMTVPIMAEPIGTTRALQEVSVRARVRGFLKEIHFKEGGDVKAGQLLFVIDEEPFQAKVDEAKAKLAVAEAGLKKARDSKAREVATAQVALDQAQLALKKIEETRQVMLERRKAASPQDVDRAVAERKRSEAQVDAAKANLQQTQADYETGILSAEADVAAAKAQLHDAEIDLGYCRMSSPIDGRIGLAQVKVGNLVGPSTGSEYTELATVRQLNPMGIDVQVSSRVLDRVTRLIQQGLPVEVFRPGLEGEEDLHFPGRATFIDNAIDPTTSTFLIRAEVANPEGTILPGEYVKSTAKIGEVKDAVVVPEQAVVETQAGPTVFSVDKAGKVKVVPVRATFTHEGLRVIEAGLEPGQAVVIEGLQLVRGGMTVKTRPAAADAPTESAGPAAKSASPAAKPAGPAAKGGADRPSPGKKA